MTFLIQLLKPSMLPYASSLPDRRLEKKRKHWQCAPHRLLSPPFGLPLMTSESVHKANYSSRPSAVKPSKTPALSPCGEEPQSTAAPRVSPRDTCRHTLGALCVCATGSPSMNWGHLPSSPGLFPFASAGVRKMHQIKQPL